MIYPEYRSRRLRGTPAIRNLVAEARVSAESLVMPYFVTEQGKAKQPIKSMPGQYRYSPDALLREIEKQVALNVQSVLLFGIPKTKDAKATSAYASKGIVQQAIRQIKKHFPDVAVIADTCLCEYTDHGHCGIVRKQGKQYEILNDQSVEILARVALSQAEAGADMIAPSDMMDGRVSVIRENLDERGFENIPIMSYAAKYASAFYGPFREAAGSTPQYGDRKTYQMDPRNSDEAMREITLDIDEGADIVMVKPALAYLDIVRRAKEEFKVPIAAYNVSGEYAYVKWAASTGVDERTLVMEIMTSIKRAGADIIITYHALDVAKWLAKGDK